MGEPKTLLMFCYPRSMSNVVYKIIGHSLRGHLETFEDVPGGEVLAFWDDRFKVRWRWFSRNEMHYRRCRDLLLSECRQGKIIKDVDQPFLLQRFLREHPDLFNVLHIRRPLADIILRMYQLQWWTPFLAYPETASLWFELKDRHGMVRTGEADGSPEWLRREILPLMVSVVVRLWRDVYSKVPTVIDYGLATHDHTHLFEVVRDLGYAPEVQDYLRPRFKGIRDAKLAYRQTPLWRDIAGMVDQEARRLGLSDVPTAPRT